MAQRRGNGQSGEAPDRSVLRRALMILECFTEQQSEQTIGALSSATGLPPATVHRMLAILVDWGGVERVERGRYRLGLRLWRIGATVPQTRELRSVTLPYLEDLYEATHETVALAVRDGLEALYVELITGHRTTRMLPQLEMSRPLHATGVGKVLLAFSSPELLDSILLLGLRQLTSNTITKEFALRQELHSIRRSGIAVSRAEATPGAIAVAAPILAGAGNVVASVSVIVPTHRFDRLNLQRSVLSVSRSISRHLTPR